MEILNIHLSNFRNAASRKVVFDPKLTVITGPNGIGKTNLLEAIGLLGAVRTRQVLSDLDLVKFGQSEAKIEGKIKKTEVVNLVINYQVIESRARKSYFADSIKKRQIDLIDYFSIVVFAPTDLDLVGGSPSLRRHHLDRILSSVDRDYFRSIRLYQQVVVRRNRVLSRIAERFAKPNELDFWDERLLENGKIVSTKRKEYIDFLNFVEMQSENGDFSWELVSSEINSEKLARNRGRDIAAGVTLSGPHRDDFRFIFKKKNLEYFGSRGEQRMAVLSLKLAELEFYNVKRGTRPVLALDDIFSELDWEHRETILSIVSKQQTIITAAEVESLPKKIFKMAKVVALK